MPLKIGELAEIERKSKEMMAMAFEHMPHLSEKEKALLVNLGGRLYNQGIIDTMEELVSAQSVQEVGKDE